MGQLPGSRPPAHTMADVAALAGVSVSTVSRALRGSSLVSVSTMRRVREAAHELGFAVSRTASSLATGRTGRVAVLIGGRLGTWFNATALDGLSHVFADAGLDLLVFTISDVAERAAFFDRLPAQGNADALVVISFALAPDEHAALDRLGIPVVYLNQRADGSASVSIDDHASAAAGTHYLIGLGHRRLAFVGRQQDDGVAWSAVARVDGFRAAVVESGLVASEQVVLLEPDGVMADDVLARLLARPARPTAIVAESDEIAFGLLSALGRAGIVVPDAMSLLGFDDHQLAEPFELSTIAQPLVDMTAETGRITVQLLRTALDGGEPTARPEAPPQRVIPTRILVRRTTAPPPAAPPS